MGLCAFKHHNVLVIQELILAFTPRLSRDSAVGEQEPHDPMTLVITVRGSDISVSVS